MYTCTQAVCIITTAPLPGSHSVVLTVWSSGTWEGTARSVWSPAHDTREQKPWCLWRWSGRQKVLECWPIPSGDRRNLSLCACQLHTWGRQKDLHVSIVYWHVSLHVHVYSLGMGDYLIVIKILTLRKFLYKYFQYQNNCALICKPTCISYNFFFNLTAFLAESEHRQSTPPDQRQSPFCPSTWSSDH